MDMIKGVEVLNKIAEYKEVSGIVWILLCFIMAVGGFVIIVGFLEMSDDFYYSVSIIKLIVGIVLLILGVIGSVYAKKIEEQPTGKYQYQVAIDDTVVMSEFYDKYEVIEVEGKIYTIREKDGE